MWERAGLIGATGFVGGVLQQHVPFARCYNSRTIDKIAGETFDTLVCAGAPATMWAANADPAGDRANLQRLREAISSARFDRLVLISTIAVFDNLAAGYDEYNGSFETEKAYGRHRRELEVWAKRSFPSIIIRLPALFGPGLKKNFIFDLLNPLPSFVKPDRFAALMERFTALQRELAVAFYAYDDGLGMFRLDRPALSASDHRAALECAFAEAGFLARDFTNSQTAHQFYNVRRLKSDIETVVDAQLPTVNICSEPWKAGELHQALMGSPFTNLQPPVVSEDMRTAHAAAFGRKGPYLYDKAETLRDLDAFMRAGGQ